MFEIAIDGFSGPLDLLCHMIDGGEIEASKVSVSEVISLYARYLAENGELSISQVADFIAQAAHLLRQKASSLMPRYVDDGQDDIYTEDDVGVEDLLERYRPYRTAAEKLIELKETADRRRFREGDRPEPMFDLGNLYALSLQWLDLLHRYMSDREAARAAAFLEDDCDYDYGLDGGLPAEIPDEVQVEKRMERIMESMEAFPEGLSMRFLLAQERGVGPLVVTLLALLELSRKNMLTLTQKELFSDVFITYRAG